MDVQGKPSSDAYRATERRLTCADCGMTAQGWIRPDGRFVCDNCMVGDAEVEKLTQEEGRRLARAMRGESFLEDPA